MHNKIRSIYIFGLLFFLLANSITAQPNTKEIVIQNSAIRMTLNFDRKACITALVVGGQKVVSNSTGIFTSMKVGGIVYSSLKLTTSPQLIRAANLIQLNGIHYGAVTENWLFKVSAASIKWTIERYIAKNLVPEEVSFPEFNFDSINTWEGAYQGFGGLAWFYLFNEKLNTYGVHTSSSSFWNSQTDNGLHIQVDAPGKQVAMKYCRTINDKLAYAITVSNRQMRPKLDSGTNRRLFLRGRTDVWAPFSLAAGAGSETITLSYFKFSQKYGRGKLKGIDGKKAAAVLNTISRIGVIDSLRFGGNSWATPYGPICLHEQYIAQLGLGIDDPEYLNGYKSCLDDYCKNAIKPDGRVFSRWAYTNEDAMPGQFNSQGFYEAQWGILMDSNPDLVSNIADLYNLTGDKKWVQTHQQDCEKALNWILQRDSNHNGLVEMMTDSQEQKQSSDWIDIVWASFENAFVNVKLYHALIEWAAIEDQLGSQKLATKYDGFAALLKKTFNKDSSAGGFWDAANGCYDYWRDKNQVIHGRNMVTPVNFMAIAYGICDDIARKKLILDNIEVQMRKEHLFFWPLSLYGYGAGEAKQSQYPFPSYENGDIFLSWGSIGVKAYAELYPSLAMKYINNVISQYAKDGLAFQRYGRLKQNGLGDDILSGNSLTLMGLYQSIYGVNPLYNRLYLEPHLTPKLFGTRLRYCFRDKRLIISLDSDQYAIDDSKFKLTDRRNFGFNSSNDQLKYFNGNSIQVSMQIKSQLPLAIDIKGWDESNKSWQQNSGKKRSQIKYSIFQLKPNTRYKLVIGDRLVKWQLSDAKGEIAFVYVPIAEQEKISLIKK